MLLVHLRTLVSPATRRGSAASAITLAVIAIVLLRQPPAQAEINTLGVTDQLIAVQADKDSDSLIQARIQSIFSRIRSLENIEIVVADGIVELQGEVASDAAAEQAINIVSRVEGVIAVEDLAERTLDLKESITPIRDSVRETSKRWARALPLAVAALIIFLLVSFIGHLIANRSSVWNRLTRNPFLAQIISQAIRVAGILLGILLALNLLGATALMGTILGSAGVVGLAISFGVKDTIENYIASIMLSVRQPFRAEDHVVINDLEGIVVRLTSRSTIIMTLDGNHLRIPNGIVYSSPILNYTRNPQRRFDFVLGVDAEDDPADAMSVGIKVIQELDWVLDEPAPYAIIETVGDSNILIKFMGWIDQRDADFGKSRSLSIRAAKNALEEKGFTLPEPIYRLRFDNAPQSVDGYFPDRGVTTGQASSAASQKPVTRNTDETDTADVTPETHVSDRVRDERIETGEQDLLDDNRPIE